MGIRCRYRPFIEETVSPIGQIACDAAGSSCQQWGEQWPGNVVEVVIVRPARWGELKMPIVLGGIRFPHNSM